MTEKEHQYYRRCALCDPDLIVCPVCNGSGKVPGPSSEDDLLVDEGTYPLRGVGAAEASVFRPGRSVPHPLLSRCSAYLFIISNRSPVCTWAS